MKDSLAPLSPHAMLSLLSEGNKVGTEPVK